MASTPSCRAGGRMGAQRVAGLARGKRKHRQAADRDVGRPDAADQRLLLRIGQSEPVPGRAGDGLVAFLGAEERHADDPPHRHQ